MSDEPKNTLQAVAMAMRDSDIDQGHATPGTPQWGRYEVLAGVAIETLQKRMVGKPITSAMLDLVLEGKL